MSKERVNGADFRIMMFSGAAAIENIKTEINELNVFPVPDGDTGTNMSLTMSAAVEELKKSDSISISETADITASGLLRGARGNSGVILSLLFRGISRALKDLQDMDGADFARALKEGVEAAYKAVMKPAEGTILTVSRVSAEHAASVADINPSFDHVLEETIAKAKIALEETMNQNPMLKRAGVIDAGGKGYVVILEGMLSALRGEPVTAEAKETVKSKASFAEFETEEIKFSYCTEFIVNRENKKREPARLRQFLESIGDSVVVVDDDQIIKVHVHTNNPGRVLEEGIRFGSLTSIKIDNMREQHSQKVITEDISLTGGRVIAKPEKQYGFVVVCAGEGLMDVFRDLGADAIIEGGQTMNPSMEDILRMIDSVPAENVFVLPNNKNIIMAAEQCADFTDKNLIVLPSRSVPQGISALLAFDASATPTANREIMIEALSNVTSAQVTYAARDSDIDGRKIREGDYIAMLDENLFTSGRDQSAVIRRLAREIGKKNPSFITLFYGEHLDESDAEKVRAIFAKECSDAEITLINGGQPVYYYLISAE